MTPLTSSEIVALVLTLAVLLPALGYALYWLLNGYGDDDHDT